MCKLPIHNLHVKTFFYYFIILFLSSSCQTIAIYNFEGMAAPKVIVPPDVKTMAFVDRNLWYEQDTAGMYFQDYYKIQKDSVVYDSITAKQAYLAFNDSKSELLAIDTLPFYSLDKTTCTGTRSYTPLEWNQVDSLCAIDHSDVIVSLEDIQIYTNYSSIDVDNEMLAFVDISYFTVWRIYDPLTRKYIDERVLVDSLFLEAKGRNYQKLLKNEQIKRAKIIKDIAYHAGEKYCNLLSPSWIKIQRNYFVAGNTDFSVAYYYMQNDDLDAAMAIWKKLSSNENVKIAARACFNMAFGMELKEDFKTSEKWLKKSKELYKRLPKMPKEYKLVNQYNKELIKRYQNIYRLDKFFGDI